MTTTVRFVEWKPKKILEKDLPEGVRYRLDDGSNNTLEYIAADLGRYIIVADNGNPVSKIGADVRKNHLVTILDWPEWCGRRPAEQCPTWNDIIRGAPSSEALTVWRNIDEPYVGGAVSIMPASDGPANGGCTGSTFLGWLVIELGATR